MITLTAPEQVGLSSGRLERIEPVLQRYINDKKLAGMVALIARRGQPVYCKSLGYAHREAGLLMQPDTIFRIYSMSKPITSVAVMMLVEEGLLRLDSPLYEFAPCFKDCQVLVSQNGQNHLEPLKRDIHIHHLLTHTSGLGYNYDPLSYIDGLFRQRIPRHNAAAATISFEDLMRAIASIPLVYQPGESWRYSIASDVLGYVVETVSGQAFGAFLQERIFEPLGMTDTAFTITPEKVRRFAANYGPAEDGSLKVIDDPFNSVYSLVPKAPSGSGGLISSAPDYFRFCQMLLNKGELHGQRLLSRKTVEYMTLNHLPGGLRIDEEGQGFGLGFSVLVEPVLSSTLGSAGTYRWGGAANTRFWVDPQEELIGLLMLQYMPNGVYPVDKTFQNLVYQAIID